MALKAVYLDPTRGSVSYEGSHVEVALNADGALESAAIDGRSVEIPGLQGILSDSKTSSFTVTVKQADGSTEGPFEGVQHINLRVNYGMNVVELLQFERLQRIWYSQKAPAAAAS
jgi:hypothetical protein